MRERDVADGPSPAARARFEELARSYAGLIRAAVRKAAGVAADRLGPDIEQRLLMELWKRHHRDEPIEHPSSYIYRAAVRETIRVLQRDARDQPSELTREPLARRADDPHARLRSKEIARALDEEIEALSSERSQAVRFHLAGFAVDEIMSLRGWSYHKARNLIARGMSDLRRRLGRRGIHGD